MLRCCIQITPSVRAVLFSMASVFGSNKLPAARLLLEAGANPRACARAGTMPLHSACSNPSADPELVRALLDWPGGPGADEPQRPDALIRVMLRGHRLLVRRLGVTNKIIRWGCTGDGLTPLGHAAMRGDAPLCASWRPAPRRPRAIASA